MTGLGLVVLAGQLPRLTLHPHILSSNATGLAVVDVLGVAQHDFAFTDGRHVLLDRFMDHDLKTVWQTNFPHEVRLTGALDLTGDGSDEVCLAAADSTGARAFALDANGREVLALGPVRGRSMRPGYPWDGRLEIAATLVRDGRLMGVCRLCTDYARQPRGIALYDLATRRRVWLFPMGAYPRDLSVTDLNADGAPEILVSTGAPANGASLNGTDDEHCYAIVLDASGRRLWQVTVGGYFAATEVLALPPADGVAPLVVVTSSSLRAKNPEPGRLLLLDAATGGVLVRREFSAGFGPPRALGEGGRFVVGSRDGALRLYGPDLRLLAQRRFRGPVQAWQCADVDDDGDAEVVASTESEALILSGLLHVRARLPHLATPGSAPGVSLAHAGLGHTRLAVSDGRALVAEVESWPPLADPRRLGLLAGLAFAAGIGAALWRTPRRWKTLPAGAVAREFLLDYHQIRHETFDRERPFARVRLWAQAAAAGHPLPAEVLESACDEFARIGLPTLMRYADRARALRVERSRVAGIRTLSRSVAFSLSSVRGRPDEERRALVASVLVTVGELSETCAEAYWEVAVRKPCRPDLEAQEALLGKRATLDRYRVASRFHAEVSGMQPVLFDGDELRALLGELVENGARAVSGAPDAAISVTVTGSRSDLRWVHVLIADNGPGVPPPQRDALFAPENSSRPDGGGFGLYHAREVARRWLGDLALEEPPDGCGALLRLTLRALRIADLRAPVGVGTEDPLT
ncbi:MAG: hypothetical protein HZC42_04300 [Candidatus Eisenbacteria bacterium]|nr:hypothetical protein [Candidatus Eisenbacteria bacterium]